MISNEKLELLTTIEELEAELAAANSKVDDLREEFTIAAMRLAEANALLDEVGKWRLSLKWDGAKIGTHKFGIFTELDDILSKRREVE